MQFDAQELRQAGFQMVPYPDRDSLAGGVLKPFDIVHALMVELFDHRPNHRFEVGKIHHPLQPGMQLVLHPNPEPVSMAMHFPAFVSLRHKREEMGRVEREFLE